MALLTKFNTKNQPTWCPGCGDYLIWGALKAALVDLKLEPSQVLVVFGVGCSGNMADFLKVNGVHALHGRGLPLAAAARLANPNLTVLAVVGDGDCYGEGLGHLLATIRENHNLTILVHNNNVYGLTTGQKSPTAPQGLVTKTTPQGVAEKPVNPLALALASDISFLGRGFAGNLPQLRDLIKSSIVHQGTSLVDILQPCTTYNKSQPHAWYLEKTFWMDKPLTDLAQAWQAANQSDKLPLGIFWQQARALYEDQYPFLKDNNLLELPTRKISY